MGSPFVVPTSDLFRRPGARTHVRRTGRLPGVSLSSAWLTDDDVTVDATLDIHGSSITVSGTVTAQWAGQCRRCLETTEGELTVELDEVFSPDPVEGETYPLARDHLDLTPALREALALALPLAPLCDEACAGPDPQGHPVEREHEVEPEAEGAPPGEAGRPRGANGANGEKPPPADPRWAALDELRFDR